MTRIDDKPVTQIPLTPMPASDARPGMPAQAASSDDTAAWRGVSSYSTSQNSMAANGQRWQTALTYYQDKLGRKIERKAQGITPGRFRSIAILRINILPSMLERIFTKGTKYPDLIREPKFRDELVEKLRQRSHLSASHRFTIEYDFDGYCLKVSHKFSATSPEWKDAIDYYVTRIGRKLAKQQSAGVAEPTVSIRLRESCAPPLGKQTKYKHFINEEYFRYALEKRLAAKVPPSGRLCIHKSDDPPNCWVTIYDSENLRRRWNLF